MNEVMEPKQEQYPVVDVTGDRSKVQCCKEQYCVGTWNVRSMSQGKLEAVKQEMASVNTDILGISDSIESAKTRLGAVFILAQPLHSFGAIFPLFFGSVLGMY